MVERAASAASSPDHDLGGAPASVTTESVVLHPDRMCEAELRKTGKNGQPLRTDGCQTPRGGGRGAQLNQSTTATTSSEQEVGGGGGVLPVLGAGGPPHFYENTKTSAEGPPPSPDGPINVPSKWSFGEKDHEPCGGLLEDWGMFADFNHRQHIDEITFTGIAHRRENNGGDRGERSPKSPRDRYGR